MAIPTPRRQSFSEFKYSEDTDPKCNYYLAINKQDINLSTNTTHP